MIEWQKECNSNFHVPSVPGCSGFPVFFVSLLSHILLQLHVDQVDLFYVQLIMFPNVGPPTTTKKRQKEKLVYSRTSLSKKEPYFQGLTLTSK